MMDNTDDAPCNCGECSGEFERAKALEKTERVFAVRGELNQMGFCKTDVSSVMGKLEDTNIEYGRGKLSW